jgi:hypothetical protein
MLWSSFPASIPFMEAGKAGQNNFDRLHGSGAFKERVESL